LVEAALNCDDRSLWHTRHSSNLGGATTRSITADFLQHCNNSSCC
jgi:hypothetical protein